MKQVQRFYSCKSLTIIALVALMVFAANSAHAQRNGGGGRPGGNPGSNNRGGRPVPVPVRGQRYAVIGRPSVNITFGGVPYHYANGYYYRPYDNYYRVVAPPRGIRVSILPTGYWSVRVGALPFFYFDGVFYKQMVVNTASGVEEKNYEVVDAPVGAQVPSISQDAKVMVINDNKYYEVDGTYYSEIIRDNGQVWYEVAGKNGQLNTPEAAPLPQVGDRYEQLPESCKVVILSGQKYYVSETKNYYQEVIEGNRLYYKLVAKADQGM